MQNLINKYKSIVETAFINADNHYSKINDKIIEMEGMTGLKTRHFYNNLLNFDDARYLEIGTWKGSSVCSAMYQNNADIVCIDNWSAFSGSEWGDVKNTFLANINEFKGINNIHFIESDCFQVDVSILPKFNIYLFDGDHSEESQYRALQYYYECLDDVFIFIVDDWNWNDVRNGTRKAIQDLNFKVLYEEEKRLTFNNEHTPPSEANATWWNGIYVSVLQK